ncbi:hypothetical protein CMI38_02880 [Candidatus Pacearchaeota archaeon]|nr:hypothetical protein [Candidatus Pacearchaeota archaeon]|tara:strand:- start:74 stop:595 length:522 start_codon:yes stop_codon:yes gene_type:complete
MREYFHRILKIALEADEELKSDKKAVKEALGAELKLDKKVRRYFYNGQEVAYFAENNYGEPDFVSVLAENELFEILRGMDLRDKIHLRRKAYGLYVVAEHFDMKDDDWVDDEDIGIYVNDIGAESLSDLSRIDNKAYRLVKERNLVGLLFGDEVGLDENKFILEVFGKYFLER